MADGVAVGLGVAVGAGVGVAVGFGVAVGVGVGVAVGFGVGLAAKPTETAEKIAVAHNNFRNECSLIFRVNVGVGLSLESVADASNFGNFDKLNRPNC